MHACYASAGENKTQATKQTIKTQNQFKCYHNVREKQTEISAL